MCFNTKKIISVFLTVAMLLSTLNIPVFATETTDDTEIAESIEQTENITETQEILVEPRTDSQAENIEDSEENIIAEESDDISLMSVAEDFAWELSDDGTLTISGNGDMPVWSSESKVSWYSDGAKIINVVIENGITNIGNFAFSGCSGLTSITIPESVTSIGGSAFSKCSGLTSITIPGSVTSIGGSAFSSCGSLTSVTILEGLRSIGRSAFFECSSLTSITIPESVTSIGISAFSNCSNLKEVHITDIAAWCGIKFIGGYYSNPLHYAKNLYLNGELVEELVIPEGVTIIADYAFLNCSILTSVTILEGVTSIGDFAFSECSGLTSITIPESVTSIGISAFSECSGLTSITIPESVTSIGNAAFYNCSNLKEVHITDIAAWCGIKFMTDASNPMDCAKNLYLNGELVEELVIPEGVTSIGSYAFSSCGSLTSVTIPESVTSIGYSAFSECSGLTSITIPESVTSIGNSAFSNCSNLKEVHITDIAAWCGIKFNGYYSNPLHYAKNLYLNGELVEELVIPEGVTSIGSYAFYSCGSLTSVTILEGLRSIGDSAFSECSGLTSITIPESVTSIGNSAFSECSGLTSITIPESVTSIGIYAFLNCSILTSVTILEGVTSIGYSAFSGCSGLTSITIPGSVTSIADYAFHDCSILTSVTIPDSVTSIGGNTFNGCAVNFVIYGYLDSYAEKYALQNNIAFEVIEGQGINLLIVNSENEKIKIGYEINWYDSDENVVGTGNVLRGVFDGKTYSYEIVLDEELSYIYKQPEKAEIVGSGENEEITVKLENISESTIIGTVVDENDNPIIANIKAVQTFNDKYEKEIQINTDNNGVFSAKLSSVPTTLEFAADGYYNRKRDLTESDLSKNEYNLGKITMSKLPTDKITLSISKQSAVKSGEESLIMPISSANNLSFKIKNKTKGTDITDFTVQYPNLIIGENTADGNDVIEISVTDNKNQMTSQAVEITLDENKIGFADIIFTENGSVEISGISGNSENTVMVFKENGDFVKSYTVTDSFTSDIMTEGTYKLVFIKKTDLLSGVSNISKLSELGLVEGTDYAVKTVNIRNGIIAEISNITIPLFDESKLYYTVSENTGFMANKPSVAVGNYMTLRAEYEIDEKYSSTNQKIQIEIPEGVLFAETSLTVDGVIHPYTKDGNKITINTNKPKGIIRFYVVPTVAGNHNVNAYLTFSKDNSEVIQPVGTAIFEGVAATISIPEKTGKKEVTATGTIAPRSTITLYDNGEKVGETTSNANGSWSLKFELVKPYSYSLHEIYGVISSNRIEETITTDVSYLLYNETYADVSKVTMIGQDDTVVFDFLNPTKTLSYTVNSTSDIPFTFKVEFANSNNAVISDVNVVTEDSYGVKKYIPVYYSKDTDLWVGYYKFSKFSDLPVSLSVEYNAENMTINVSDEMVSDGKDYIDTLQKQIQECIDSNDLYQEDIVLSDVLSSEELSELNITEYSSQTGLGSKIQKYTVLINDEYVDIFSMIDITSISAEDIDFSEFVEVTDDNNNIYYINESIEEACSVMKIYSVSEQQLVTIKGSDSLSGLIYGYTITPFVSGSDIASGIGIALGVVGLGIAIPTVAGVLGLSATAATEIGLAAGIGSMISSTIGLGMTYLDLKDVGDTLNNLKNKNLNCYNSVNKAFNNVSKKMEGISWFSSVNDITGFHLGVGAVAGSRVASVGGLFSTVTGIAASIWSLNLSSDLEKIKKQAENCQDEPENGDKPTKKSFSEKPKYVAPRYDPSGFVYEAVPSNRVEGVKAECYQYDYALDDFGVPVDDKSDIFWNAEDYDQENPLYTDKNGMYHWDVPMGEWLVKFSKEGYYDTDSRNDPAANENGYLPVPPPQTEVNTAIVSKSAPAVENVNVYNDEIQIIFSQYMKLDSVNTNTVKVKCGGKEINGTITPSNAEYNYEETEQFASIFKFVPEKELTGEATVEIDKVKNYNSKAISAKHTQTKAVITRPESLSASESIDIAYNSGALLEVSVLPKKAGANKTLVVSSSSPSIVGVVNSTVTTDENGKANIMLEGKLPGEGEISVLLEGTDIKTTVLAKVGNVVADTNACAKVAASIENGSTVKKGTKVTLSTTTEDAEIYYTLDGTCPCVEDSASRIKYTRAIEINEDTFIIAYAVKEGMEDSPTAGFTYKVEASVEKVSKPEADPEGKSVDKGTKVKLTTDTDGATIYYTTNGKNPTKESEVYKSAIAINSKTTIKAFAVKEGMADSDIMSETYTVKSTGGGGGGGGGGSRPSGSGASTSSPVAKPTAKPDSETTKDTEFKFTDVDKNQWYYSAVKFVYEKGITNGVSETEFAPQSRVTRGQFITMLCRAYGVDEMSGDNFADAGETWYTGYLAAAKQLGISNGVGDNKFAPEKEITREEMVTLIYNYLKSIGEVKEENHENSFADNDSISDWAKSAVSFASGKGYVNGKENNIFDPQGKATRAELAQIFFNMFK